MRVFTTLLAEEIASIEHVRPASLPEVRDERPAGSGDRGDLRDQDYGNEPKRAEAIREHEANRGKDQGEPHFDKDGKEVPRDKLTNERTADANNADQSDRHPDNVPDRRPTRQSLASLPRQDEEEHFIVTTTNRVRHRIMADDLVFAPGLEERYKDTLSRQAPRRDVNDDRARDESFAAADQSGERGGVETDARSAPGGGNDPRKDSNYVDNRGDARRGPSPRVVGPTVGRASSDTSADPTHDSVYERDLPHQQRLGVGAGGPHDMDDSQRRNRLRARSVVGDEGDITQAVLPGDFLVTYFDVNDDRRIFKVYDAKTFTDNFRSALQG